MNHNSLQVLIVDDNDFMLNVLKTMLHGLGYSAITCHNGQEAMERLRKDDIHLVITDWEMPVMDGIDLCKAVRREDFPGYVYIIMLTGREGSQSKIEGLNAGADDFLNKPLNADELTVCLKTADRILALETRDVALFALAKLAESRDQETGDHLERVQKYTRLLVKNLSEEVKTRHGVDDSYMRLIYQTSPLHDLGKVAVPDRVLLKPGKLTPAEYEIMKTHTILGAQTLEAALRRFPHALFLQMARDIAATHHEKFNGAGYPRGLIGEDIPLSGRIVALADAYDALTSRRVYKAAMSHEEAKAIILGNRGKHFDPDVVDAFLQAESQMVEICKQYQHELPRPKELQQESADAVPERVYNSGPCKLLVVEDDRITREHLVKLLKKTGGKIFAATNATEARRIFLEEAPQVVISDWEMPDGDGLELCQYIRKQSTTLAVHFIMLTVHSDQQLLLNAYKAGVDDFVSKPFNPEELLARVQAGLRTSVLYGELSRKTNDLRMINSQLATMNARLDRLSVTDELTGLFNRRHAMFKVEEQWEMTQRYNQPLAVIVADIDHFKLINDTYGHEAGDRVLHSVGNILRAQTRGCDTVCRIGGEEFLIILPNQTQDNIIACAERCRQAIKTMVCQLRDYKIRATISMGAAMRQEGTIQFSDLLEAADEALYMAKRAGRNRVVFSSSITKKVSMHTEQSTSSSMNNNSLPTVLDLKRVRERCGGDKDFADAVVKRFYLQAGSEVDRITSALKEKQFDVVRRNAHNLKSMSAYVTADKASELSKQIEQLACADEAAAITNLTATLREEIDSVIQWIEQNTATLNNA